MFKTNFISHNIIEYYKNDELLFVTKREINFLRLGSVTTILNNDKLLFSFYDFDLSFLYWKLEILFQSLDKPVFLKRKRGNYILVVDNKSISLRFLSNPFKKKIGLIFIDNICVCEIERSLFTYFFQFNQNAELEYYCLLLFSMYSVGITES